MWSELIDDCLAQRSVRQPSALARRFLSKIAHSNSAVAMLPIQESSWWGMIASARSVSAAPGVLTTAIE